MSEHLEIIRRIQEIYNSCSEEEQEYLYQILKEFDKKYIDTKNINVLSEANNQIAKMAKEETSKTLNNVLYDASLHMKNGYSRSDN